MRRDRTLQIIRSFISYIKELALSVSIDKSGDGGIAIFGDQGPIRNFFPKYRAPIGLRCRFVS